MTLPDADSFAGAVTLFFAAVCGFELAIAYIVRAVRSTGGPSYDN